MKIQPSGNLREPKERCSLQKVISPSGYHRTRCSVKMFKAFCFNIEHVELVISSFFPLPGLLGIECGKIKIKNELLDIVFFPFFVVVVHFNFSSLNRRAFSIKGHRKEKLD